ncbi:MAG TPA: ATP-binding protein [Thermoanaerobaculaceae bacterium]|nr:ATP-binding protein [Thermoanaerobaculaceae bacterium]
MDIQTVFTSGERPSEQKSGHIIADRQDGHLNSFHVGRTPVWTKKRTYYRGQFQNMSSRILVEGGPPMSGVLDIKLGTRLSPKPCLAKVDAGQLEQVFLNLALNARDAMPKGGTLTFETGFSAVDETSHPDMTPGTVVWLSVSDTGFGMTDEVKSHLFEPFFTTKEMGKGTGLGLATVYGIVKQSGGDIIVESAPGRGTTFKICFPQMDEPNQQDKGKDKSVVLGGNETVLLVEDEEIIRRLGARILTANGYAVLMAADGQEALNELARHGKPVELLITDVVMPGMNGRELAHEIAKKGLARRTLFVSGYTDDAIVHHGVLEPGLAFLYKPFSPDSLLRKLREVLDGPADKAKP